MRINNFSSAADRRWQRRYERIQRRKDEEKERKKSAYEVYFETRYPDIDIHSVIHFAPIVTTSVSTSNEPNLNGTVTTIEEWRSSIENAFREFQRSLDQYASEVLYERSDEWLDSFVDVKNIALGDPIIIGVDLSGVEFPEPELDAGDNSMLDSFLGEFLAPGA